MDDHRSDTCHAVGFSLIELLAAIAILAAVTAIAIPTFSAFSSGADLTAAQADVQSCVMRVLARTPASAGQDAVSAAFTAACGFTAHADETGNGEGPRLSFEGDLFWVSAKTSMGAIALSNRGDRRWDRNRDGDFLDPGEVHWLP